MWETVLKASDVRNPNGCRIPVTWVRAAALLPSCCCLLAARCPAVLRATCPALPGASILGAS